MIEKAIIQLLRQSLALTAIVGNRIYPNIIKAGATYPAVYVAANQMEKLECDNHSGVKSGTVEIGIWSDDYQVCYDCIEAIRDKLDEYSGIINSVGITFLRGEEAPDGYDEDLKMNLKAIDFKAFAQIKSTN
ncbi:DUF3168 domain-containing protein [Dyadobacter sp. CY323]|uniref:tail completion protein gp17 n=1 Tax=Dyadobacter sp. CY323 TaxID=2907302 RepID=UPI001F362498|nr:DUF3168 domain-containing protein [Dyadobacter sp. CY323]MCE6992101.1 DUF3168 domain-containing protein [Dyadobacter sp. CY323]